MAKDEKVTVEVDGHTLQLTNLSKVLYPQTGFTKGEVIDYYTRIAPVLLPHLADRALTIKRYPNGVDEKFFFEKNAARGTPDVGAHRDAARPRLDDEPRHDRLRRRRGTGRRWSGWPTSPRSNCTSRSGTCRSARASRAPTCSCSTSIPARPPTIAECCEVAVLLRDLLAEDGVELFAKTSGSKGMQVSAPIDVDDPRARRPSTRTRSPSGSKRRIRSWSSRG